MKPARTIVTLLPLLSAGLAATGCNRAVEKPAVRAVAATNQSVPALASPRASLESVPRITAAALREKIEHNEVRVIDVRDADSFVASHIPGALQIPLAYIQSEAPYLKGPKPIVTYCT
jgi:3-mercaptopyruvate sulfurtransferase SseA